MPRDSTAIEPPAPRRFWREPELAWLLILVGCIYSVRLDSPNLRGEETRRGRVAVEMLQTGDWIVPRQQGELFLSRPPLQNWLIGLVGWTRGGVDWLAIRLPSVLAILLTVGLIYGYARGCLSPAGSFVAGLSFATMVQVLELGRLGETEALFTLAVGGSLLVWHWGWSRGWSPYLTWSLAYVLVAMGMLLKGPQGPVFFAGPVGLYLIATRRWRDLITWPHALGILTFALLWNAWQLPYFFMEGLDATRKIYGHDVGLRFVDRSWTTLLMHLLTYPLEIFSCLLPWAPLLFVCSRASFWNWLGSRREQVIFLLCCLVATFPVCWLVPGARSRYYMPLYPCFAVLVALAAEHCWQAAAKLAWQNTWRHLLAGAAVVMAVAGVGVPLIGVVAPSAMTAEPWTLAIPFAVACFLLSLVAWWAAGGATLPQQLGGCVALAAFVALTYVGPVTNARVRASNDTARRIAELKERLPADAKLVSVGLVDHMFTYHFQRPIEPWLPQADEAAWPEDAEYFCFSARNRPPQLDFAWEEVAVVACDRNASQHDRVVVVARRLPDRTAAQSSWNQPQTIQR